MVKTVFSRWFSSLWDNITFWQDSKKKRIFLDRIMMLRSDIKEKESRTYFFGLDVWSMLERKKVWNFSNYKREQKVKKLENFEKLEKLEKLVMLEKARKSLKRLKSHKITVFFPIEPAGSSFFGGFKIRVILEWGLY